MQERASVLVSTARGRAVDGSNDTRVGARDPSAPQPPRGDGSTRAPAPSTHLPVKPVQRPDGRPRHGWEIRGGSGGVPCMERCPQIRGFREGLRSPKILGTLSVTVIERCPQVHESLEILGAPKTLGIPLVTFIERRPRIHGSFLGSGPNPSSFRSLQTSVIE